MSLSDLASIGSLVSGVAVLASLVYLSLQVRQTERNQRALMNQGVIARDTSLVISLASAEFAIPWTKAVNGETEFTAQEHWSLLSMLRVCVLSLQDTRLQHEAGLTDHLTYDHIVSATRYILAQPVMRALWLDYRTPETWSTVDELIAATPLARPVNVLAQLKTRLAEVMR